MTFKKILLAIMCWTQVVLVTGRWKDNTVTPNTNDGHSGGLTCAQQTGQCCVECCTFLYDSAPSGTTCPDATGIARCLNSCEYWIRWFLESADGDEETAAPTQVPSSAPSLEPLSVERPTVVGDVTPVCLDETEAYAVSVTVLGAGGMDGTRTVPIEVVFVLDSSGSMENNDRNGHRLEAATEIVNRLDPGLDFAAVVPFDERIDFPTTLTNDLGLVRDQIAAVDAAGGTNLDVGLRRAVSLLQGSQLRAATRAIIFLTDGVGTYTYCANGGPAFDAANNGYKIYSVGLSQAADSAPLIDMAQCTGATYTSAIDGVDLTDIFQDFFGEVLESTAPLDVTLSLALQPDFTVVAGSQSPQPDRRFFDSGRMVMVWESVDNGLGLAAGDSFEVNFAVTGTRSGPLTDQLDSKVTFSTPEGATGEVKTPDLSIDIETLPDVC